MYRGIDRGIMLRTIVAGILSYQQHNVCHGYCIGIGALFWAAEHERKYQRSRSFGLYQADEAVGSNSAEERHRLR